MRSTSLVVLLAAACGSKTEPKHTPAALDAARAPAVDAGPPAPTVKSGGRGDCKTEYAPEPTRDPNPMCRLPASTFVMGAPDDGDPDRESQRPGFEVKLDEFFIDQLEVTVGQVAFYLQSVGDNTCSEYGSRAGECFELGYTDEVILDGGRYVSAPGREHHPIRHASREGATRYCVWAGKTLPTEAQWEAAARVDPATGKVHEYPWGDTYEPNRAACDPCQGDLDTLPVGSHDGTGGRLDGSSSIGVHDLAGNAQELVTGCYKPYPLCATPPCVNPETASENGKCDFMLRGSGLGPLFTRGAARKGSSPHATSGFRCVTRT